MSDSEFRPNLVGSNRNKNVYSLSIALAPHLGIPTDVIEQALIKAIEQNSADIFNVLPSSLHNGIQETKPVGELSQSTALISSGSQQSLIDMDSKNSITQESSSLSHKKNRKDSLSSLIEITQSGSTSINIKLPSLHVPPPTVQGEMTNGQSSPQSSGPFDENLNRPQYYDEKNIISNNESLMQNQEYIPPPQRVNHVEDKFTPEVQNRQNDSNFDVFKEYIPPQQREQDKYKSYNQRQRDELQADRFQDTYDSFTSDVKSRQNNFADDFSEEYFQPQRRESQANQSPDPYNRTFPQVVSPIKKNSSETYLSEYPSLSEASKMSDSRKSGVDLGAWGQMDVNLASAWGDKSKKWSSETETFEPPATTSTWSPENEDLTWRPIQEPKPPVNKRKPMTFDLDDSDGWGAPPTNTIPWDDSRQGYCVDLIEEQKETVFWSMQNGSWVNVSEEYSKTVEFKSDGVNHKNRQTMRYERQETRNVDNGATWDDLRENTRREREQMERGINENTAENIMIDLSDHSNDNSDSSEIGNYRSSSEITTGPVPIVSEGSRERLGNPQWKSEKEWRHDSQPRQFKEEDDLINLDLNEIPESRELEEPLTAASDREVGGPNEEISSWDKWKDNSGSSLEEIAEIKNDAWFTEDVLKQREDITDQDLLINIDSNNDNEVAESTIINTHPPIFYGSVNNEMSKDLNDIFDSTNSVNTPDTAKVSNMDIVNDNLSLLSFEDDGNKISKSSADQKNNNKNNPFDELVELEDFFKNSNYKPLDATIKSSNESQEKVPVIPYAINMDDKENSDISHYMTVSDNFSSFAPPSRSYRCENSSQINVEPMSFSSTIDSNDKKLEHNEYSQVPDQTDQVLDQHKGSVNESQDTADPKEPNSDSTKIATNDKDFIINLTVETPLNGRQILRLRYDDDPQIAATEFCKKWNMFHFEDALKGFVQKEQKRRLRKRRAKCKK